ncbi:MAG: SRPBCC family protein [Bacteroidetes bacterium]|nr:SRPBCC family protein [Bacteroidota bacterium]
MARTKFSEKIIINSSREAAFDYTQDYGNRLKWDTFLKKAELIDGATEAGIGVKANCVAKNGLGMITEYVSFNRPEGTAVKMTKGPFIFKSFAGSWKFAQLESEVTEVTFIYSFELRWPFGIFQRKVNSKLQTEVKQRLLDLKNYIEAKLPKNDI